MKTDTHPVYQLTTVTCGCGAAYTVGSTKKTMKVDVCAKCHPFYTGKQRIMDAGGRVERFKKRYGL